jgi:hypothetical protein
VRDAAHSLDTFLIAIDMPTVNYLKTQGYVQKEIET